MLSIGDGDSLCVSDNGRTITLRLGGRNLNQALVANGAAFVHWSPIKFWTCCGRGTLTSIATAMVRPAKASAETMFC